MLVFSALVLVLSTACLIWFIHFLVTYFRLRKIMNQFAGPADIPFIGNFHLIETDPSRLRIQVNNWADEFRAQGHGTIRFWMGTDVGLLIINCKDAEPILNSTKYLEKGEEYVYLHDWLGLGLLTSSGAKWKTRRRLLTPAFHFSILTEFMDIFNEQSRVLVDKLRQRVPKADDVFDVITKCTLDIICESAMGIKMETQASKNDDYIRAVHEMSAIVQRRQTTVRLIAQYLFPLLPDARRQISCLKFLKSFTRKVIRERKAQIAHEGVGREEQVNGEKVSDQDDYGVLKQRSAFLTTLLRSQKANSLTDDDIQEEVDTFMFEGHDTTSSALTWAIQFIGAHAHVRNKLHEEVDRVFGHSDRNITEKDLTELSYLSRVIKEVLRLCPPVPFVARKLTEDITLGSVRVPKGIDVFLLIYSIHRDPAYFPEPERIDPDRFLPENIENRHPFAYIPFSAGPRNCIGQKFAIMEVKVVLTWLLRRLTWKSVYSFEDLRPTTKLILRPSNPVTIELERRGH